MTPHSQYHVYLHNQLAGTLSFDERLRTAFDYAPDYLACQGAPISIVMPTTQQHYPDEICFPFIENLFPEAAIRKRIFEILKGSDTNFELLVEKLGGDVAGAISLVPLGQRPSENQSQLGTPLSLEEYSQLLIEIEKRPFLVEHEGSGNRLSLAGAQNKLPIIIKDSKIYEASHAPSTHIVKPPAKDKEYAGLVFNEFLCMRTAKLVKLKVADVELLHILNREGVESDALAITRFDRQFDEGHFTRIHQEDACQIRSLVSGKKYQHEGGPSHLDIFTIIDQYCQTPALDKLEYLKRLLFNIVMGNNDAHGKNVSFLHTQGKLILSPAYDLVCTEAYPDLDDTMAMEIGGEYHPNNLTAAHFLDLAEQSLIKIKGLKGLLIPFVESITPAFEQECDILLDDLFGREAKVLISMKGIIEHNSNRLIDLLESI